MRFSTLLPLLLAAGVAQAQFGKGKGKGQGKQNGQNNQQNAQNAQNQNQNQNQNGNANNNALALNPNNVQTNSQSDGLDAGAEPGQAASATDQANFINFCTGETLTNGLQVKEGSCNGIPMGKIPAVGNMVSAVMVNPQNNDNIGENEAINFQVQIANLNAGTFTNPDVTYYAAPQDLQGGNIVGHTHITVQDLGNDANPTTPPDAQDFAFFKGINDAGNNQGLLAANLAEGLPAGNYRVCSMTSAANHQPVLMPVAQRGAQDDCVRFTVGGNGNANQQGNGQGQAAQGQGKGQAAQGQGKGQAAQGQGKGQAAQGQGKGQAAQGQGKGQAAQGQGKGQAAQGQGQQAQQGQAQQGAQAGKGRGRGRFGRMKFAAREFVA